MRPGVCDNHLFYVRDVGANRGGELSPGGFVLGGVWSVLCFLVAVACGMEQYVIRMKLSVEGDVLYFFRGGYCSPFYVYFLDRKGICILEEWSEC